MNLTAVLLVIFLVGCAAAVALTKNIFAAVLIQMSFSTVMAVIWLLLLESPDLAITEAAVGAGVTGVLFFATLKRIGLIGKGGEKK